MPYKQWYKQLWGESRTLFGNHSVETANAIPVSLIARKCMHKCTQCIISYIAVLLNFKNKNNSEDPRARLNAATDFELTITLGIQFHAETQK